MEKQKPISPWLPFSIAIMGSIISITIWYGLISQHESIPFLEISFKAALPWIILIGGICIAFLSAIAIRLIQVSHKNIDSLQRIQLDYQKELNERIKAEETKQHLEVALLQGQKLQAIGTLAGGIAHDFNNILYAIIGYVEMAMEDVPKDALVYRNLSKVLEGAKRGQDLVSRILAFGRRQQQHHFNKLDLRMLIENILSLLKPTIPASVAIEFSDSGFHQPCFILGDQTQLHQVIVNIINNAVDAMDGEGSIDIQLSRIVANNEYLNKFPHFHDVSYYKIDMIDTGRGMDQRTMERIFEPFYTTKEVGKGTGLGLATVHAIMEQHQGEVSVQSQLGKGTTFTLLIPEYIEKES